MASLPSTIDRQWFLIGADILVNLSGAWYAAAFIVPAFSPSRFYDDIDTLLIDLIFGTISAAMAFKLRKIVEL